MTEQKYPADIIETVAKALHAHDWPEYTWDPPAEEALRERFRKRAVAALDALDLTVEYAPGHIGPNGPFVGPGRIAPGYVPQYIREGGEVVSCLATPWVEVPDAD